MSAYHDRKILSEFSMGKYQRNIKGYATDETQFKSVYKTLGYWWYSLGIMEEPQDIVEVCYVSSLTMKED
jgi:hypothetical protein